LSGNRICGGGTPERRAAAAECGGGAGQWCVATGASLGSGPSLGGGVARRQAGPEGAACREEEADARSSVVAGGRRCGESRTIGGPFPYMHILKFCCPFHLCFDFYVYFVDKVELMES
jgi:hypothetical protein